MAKSAAQSGTPDLSGIAYRDDLMIGDIAPGHRLFPALVDGGGVPNNKVFSVKPRYNLVLSALLMYLIQRLADVRGRTIVDIVRLALERELMRSHYVAQGYQVILRKPGSEEPDILF